MFDMIRVDPSRHVVVPAPKYLRMGRDFWSESTDTPVVRRGTTSTRTPFRSRPHRTHSPISGDRDSWNFYLAGMWMALSDV